MSKISKRAPERSKTIGDHQKYLTRIRKTLYYGKLPKTDSLSLPVTELAAELFSESQKGKTLKRLDCYDASKISRNACVSPCSLVLAMLYLERLKKCNPDYLLKTSPSDLFLVSLMVSCKFLFDDGEQDEVFVDEWAASGGISVRELVLLERDFLQAIDWEVYVGELTFWKKLNEIETNLADKQGKARGFYTYTELDLLAQTLELSNILQCIVAISVLLAATYTAGLLTVAGSMFLTSQIPGTALYHKKPTDGPLTHAFATNKTDIDDRTLGDNCRGALNAAHVLKTGFFLASIVSATDHTNKTDTNQDEDVQHVYWDWWNVPAMNWLANTSQFIERFELPFKFNQQVYTYNNPLDLNYYYQIKDTVNKATKTRIQDQMETSWHVEWTDTIRSNLFYNRIMPYLYNVKS